MENKLYFDQYFSFQLQIGQALALILIATDVEVVHRYQFRKDTDIEDQIPKRKRKKPMIPKITCHSLRKRNLMSFFIVPF